MKKISLKEVLETLNDREMKSIVGGIVYIDANGNPINGEPGGDPTSMCKAATNGTGCEGTCGYRKWDGSVTGGYCVSSTSGAYWSGGQYIVVHQCECRPY